MPDMFPYCISLNENMRVFAMRIFWHGGKTRTPHSSLHVVFIHNKRLGKMQQKQTSFLLYLHVDIITFKTFQNNISS